METSIVINVSKQAYIWRKGPLGTFIVPPRTDENDFGILVIRPQGEPQDVGGGNNKRNEPITAAAIAKDLIASTSGKSMGLYLCSAEPEDPRSLDKAEREERAFLASNPGEITNRLNPVNKIREFKTSDEPDVKKEKIRLSRLVQEEREKFYLACRKLVRVDEVEKAQAQLIVFYQELVQEGNRLWSREQTRAEVNEHHKFAAVELGLDDLPWCNVPTPRVDCEGCGEKIKKNIAICPHCGAIADEVKARKLYPEKFQPKSPSPKAA